MRRLLILSLVLASTSALAQEGRGPYVGIGVGQLDYEDAFRFIDYDDTISSFKVTGGFRFNENLAFEGYFSSNDSFSSTVSGQLGTGLGGMTPFTGSFSGDFDVSSVRVVTRKEWFLFGAGLFFSDLQGRAEIETGLGDSSASLKDSDNGYAIIFGAQFDFDSFGVRVEYEYFDTSSPADATLLGVGFLYGFGR